MQTRFSESNQAEIKTEVADESNNSATLPAIELTDLPLEILDNINSYLTTKETARLIVAARNKQIHTYLKLQYT